MLQVLQCWVEITAEPTWDVFYSKLRQLGLDMYNLAITVVRKHCPHVMQKQSHRLLCYGHDCACVALVVELLQINK